MPSETGSELLQRCRRLFDPTFYARQRVVEVGRDAFDDYMETGWRTGAWPNPLFDPAWYQERGDYVGNPLHHFVGEGAAAGRSPHPLFDPDVYLAYTPHATAAPSLYEHFFLWGGREGARPHILFDPQFYWRQRPGLAGQVNPLEHYLQGGWAEGLKPHPLFDPEALDLERCSEAPLLAYVRGDWRHLAPHPLFDPDHYRSVRRGEVDGDPLQHYLTTGWREGAWPHVLFDGDLFLQQRPDLVEVGLEPLTHYAWHGAQERNEVHPLFSTPHYLEQAGDTGGLSPLHHYLTVGWRKGWSPHPLFDPLSVLAGGQSGEPLSAYLNGEAPGDPHPLFDRTHYRLWSGQQSPELDPLLAYAKDGWASKGDPHPLFDTSFYLSQSPSPGDARTPLEHYLRVGWKEGRWPHPLFDPAFYLAGGELPVPLSPLEHYILEGRAAGRPTTRKPVRALVEQLMREGDLRTAAAVQGAFSPSPLGPKRRVFLARVRPPSAADETSEEHVELEPPRVSGRAWPGLRGGTLTCPPAFVARYDDAVHVAGTRVVITADGELVHGEIAANLSDPDLSVKPRSVVPHVVDGWALVDVDKRPADRLPSGIVLSSDHDENYFHWMVEVLPKLVLADETPGLEGVPLLVRDDLHPNLRRALDLANVTARPVIPLKARTAYQVDRLYCPSDVCRVVDRYMGPIRFETDCILSPSWLRKTRDRLLAALPQVSFPTHPLFITRHRPFRRVVNIDALDLWFAERGYVVETFEGVSLDYQIARARGATTLAAVTGAAATNMMFCPDGTDVYILLSEHPGQSLYLWHQLAACFGHRLTYVAGRRQYNQPDYPMHDDFEIDPALLADAGLERR